jgi:hypothetical protein
MRYVGIGFECSIPILRQQRDWVGGVRKMAIFADVQSGLRSVLFMLT